MTTEFAGALRERVSIEHRFHDRNVWAGAAGGYGYGGAAWAAIAPLSPRILVSGDSYSAQPRWRVTLRERGDLSLDSRVVWRGKYLKVREVEADPAQPGRMRVTCEEQR